MLPGLDKADVVRLNQLISNAASQNVRSPLMVQTANVAVGKGRVVIVLTIPKGLDKPYFDRNGVIWLKSGADKRRVNSKEGLRSRFSSQTSFMPISCPPWPGLTSWIKYNPILVSYAAKGLMPYKGLGSGIKCIVRLA